MFEKIKAKKIIDELFSLIMICSRDIPIYNENRDFVEFEFAFYCYFINDYRIYCKEDAKFRNLICDLFVEKLDVERKGNFKDNELDEIFNNHIHAYYSFIKSSKTIGMFLDSCADYMNAMLTISIKNNGYSNGDILQLDDIKEVIKKDIFTALIRKSMTLNTSMIL